MVRVGWLSRDGVPIFEHRGEDWKLPTLRWEPRVVPDKAQTAKTVALVCFDEVLFRTPVRPGWWPFVGYQDMTQSLAPPCVPDKPDGCLNAAVCDDVRKLHNDPTTWTVLHTFRTDAFRTRVLELMSMQQVPFDMQRFRPVCSWSSPLGKTHSLAARSSYGRLAPLLTGEPAWAEDRHLLAILADVLRDCAAATSVVLYLSTGDGRARHSQFARMCRLLGAHGPSSPDTGAATTTALVETQGLAIALKGFAPDPMTSPAPSVQQLAAMYEYASNAQRRRVGLQVRTRISGVNELGELVLEGRDYHAEHVAGLKQARRKARLALQERLRRALPAIDWDLESSCVRNTKAAGTSRQKRRRRARPAAEWTLQMEKVRGWSHRWREHEWVQDSALGDRWCEGGESEGSESEEEEYGTNAGEQPRESCAEGEDQGFVVLASPVFLAEYTAATAWPPMSGTSRREEHQQDEGFVVVGCAEVLAAAEEDECGAAMLSESNANADCNRDKNACADLADVTAWPPLPGTSRREEHQAAAGTRKEVTTWARLPCAVCDVAGTSGSDCLDAPARPRSGAGGRRETAEALAPPCIADVLLWVGDGEGAEDWELVDETDETTTRR